MVARPERRRGKQREFDLVGKARDLMQRDVGVIDALAPLAELERCFVDGKVSGFPVLRDGVVVGVVSRADVVASLIRDVRRKPTRSSYYGGLESFEAEELVETFAEVTEQNRNSLEGLRVEDVMTPWVVAVSPRDSLEQVARTLVENHVHRALVIDEERLVGLISTLDFARLFADGRVSYREKSHPKARVRKGKA